MKPARLEVCVDTVEGIGIAADSGADRIELCSCLSVGGLTPSLGLMRAAAAVACPTRVMIRPREGDFTYSPAEIDIMLRDIDSVADIGLEGVVLGANYLSGILDGVILTRLIGHARKAGLKTTLHRSFDLAPDLFEALTTANELGIDCILTSGGALAALAGVDTLRQLVAFARVQDFAVELMAGVGVGSKTARDIVERSGIGWVHGSCSLPRAVMSPEALRLGYSSVDHRHTDASEVAALLQVLKAIAEAPLATAKSAGIYAAK